MPAQRRRVQQLPIRLRRPQHPTSLNDHHQNREPYPTLLSSLLGGYLADRRKYKREDMQQWRDEVRHACIAGMTAVEGSLKLGISQAERLRFMELIRDNQALLQLVAPTVIADAAVRNLAVASEYVGELIGTDWVESPSIQKAYMARAVRTRFQLVNTFRTHFGMTELNV